MVAEASRTRPALAQPERAPNLQHIDATTPDVRVAYAHDWLVGVRGGELVLDRIIRLFGPSDLYTLVRDDRIEHTPAIDECTVHTSSMQGWPGGPSRLRRWYLPLFPRAIESLTVKSEIDVLLSTSSAFMKSIQPPQNGGSKPVPHVCYCHSPARYIYDQRRDYRGFSPNGRLRSFGLSVASPRLRVYDRATSHRVTRFIANSTHTARRIETVYDRGADVIHPPVDIDFFVPDSDVKRESFFLVACALEPYKRTDLAIRAAMAADVELRIAGEGSEFTYLQRISEGRANIRFEQQCDRAQLRDLYRRARALIVPQLEDFGIAPVEAMACGCPVIAFGKGGAEDWMTPDVGLTLDDQSVRALAEAILEFDPARYSTETCRNNALRFAPAEFDRRFLSVVREVTADTSG